MTYLSVPQAARRLGVSDRTVLRWIEGGRLQAIRSGKRFRVPMDAVRSLPGAGALEPPLRVDTAIGRCLERILTRAEREGFSRYFTEADVSADLAAELRDELAGESVEIRLQLATAGASGRQYPDLSVIPAMEGLSDRRGSQAWFSFEAKFFGYNGARGYRMGDPGFDELLAEIASQFRRLRERVQAGLLGGGGVVWLDSFDWQEREPPEGRAGIIRERVEWVRRELADPASRVRVDYLPVLFPESRVTILNGLPAAARPRRPGSLLGAALPFIKRWPAPDEDWDEAAAQAAAEDWRAKAGS